MGLAVQTCWYLGLGGFWAFVERIADHGGLEPTDIAYALGIDMLIGTLGALAAAVLGDRYGRVWPFCMTLVVHALLMRFLVGAITDATLVTVMILYNLSWNFGIAYLQGLIASADSDGQFIVLVPLFQAFGTGVGPLIAGSLIVGYGFVAVNIFAALTCVVGLILFLPFALRATRGDYG